MDRVAGKYRGSAFAKFLSRTVQDGEVGKLSAISLDQATESAIVRLIVSQNSS